MEITQGVPFSSLVKFDVDSVPMDLTGYTFQAQVRAGEVDGALLFDLQIVEVNLAQGEIRITLTAEQTSQTCYFGDAFWDLLAIPVSGESIRTEATPIEIKRGVTQPTG